MGRVQYLDLSNNRFNKLDRDKLFIFIIFALIFIRYCYYGFHYYNQLDDYILYHNFTSRPQKPLPVMFSSGLLGSRPLACLGDIFFWSHFYPAMIAGVAVISVLFASSAGLLRWVFAQHFGTSYLFCVIYSLLPLGFEGTYWMSAATRIVVGLFFAALALYGFERWCHSGKIRMFLCYSIFQLLAYGLYEQVLIFSMSSVLLVAVLNFKKHRSRSLCGLFSFVNVVFYYLICLYLSHGNVFSGRGKLVSINSLYYWKIVFPSVLKQLKDAFLMGGFYTITKGFQRGIGLLLDNFNFLYVAGLLALVILLFSFVKSSKNQGKKSVSALVAGLFLAVAPVSLFFFIDNSWFSFRGTVVSFCGLALIADTLFALMFGKCKNPGQIAAWAISLFALLCCISSISELHDYRETTMQDQKFVNLLEDALKSDDLMRKGVKVGILNLNPTYLDNQNYYYHDHIHGVTESGWALHGALESFAGYYIPDLATFPQNPMYTPWNRDSSQLKIFNTLYLYEHNALMRVNAVEVKEGQYIIYTIDGKLIGDTWEENGYGYLKLRNTGATP